MVECVVSDDFNAATEETGKDFTKKRPLTLLSAVPLIKTVRSLTRLMGNSGREGTGCKTKTKTNRL